MVRGREGEKEVGEVVKGEKRRREESGGEERGEEWRIRE